MESVKSFNWKDFAKNFWLGKSQIGELKLDSFLQQWKVGVVVLLKIINVVMIAFFE